MEGRDLEIKKCSNGVAEFSFEELCEKVLGASDYIAISRNFKAIILRDIPKITMENRNAARRFILFIDEAYNNRLKLYMNSSFPLDDLFDIKG
jgi:predicted ATPase